MSDKNKVNFAVLVKEFGENIVAHIEHAKLTAKITRAKYEGLLTAGFTEQQALELCVKG